MPPPRSRDLVYLSAYLREKSRNPLANRNWPWGVIAPLSVIAIFAATAFLAEELPFWMPLLFLPIALIVFASTAVRISWALQQPRNEAEKRQIATSETARNLAKAYWAKQIQPYAARLLEGCAYHRARILYAMSKPGWESGHRKSLAEQATTAANQAMDDALMICADFAGPGYSRGAAWKDLAQDFAEGQIGDGLKRLQTMLEADKPGEIIDRRKLPAELWPVYEIAVKLQRLASEMESTARATEPIATSTNALDQVLSDLSAVRIAEQELESSQQVRQR